MFQIKSDLGTSIRNKFTSSFKHDSIVKAPEPAEAKNEVHDANIKEPIETKEIAVLDTVRYDGSSR